MPDRKHTYLENIQLTVFTIGYFLSCILLYWLLTFLFDDADILIIALASLAFLLIATLGWAYLYVLFSIPQRIPGSFDYLKNDISSGKLVSPLEFQKELCSFLVKFYNYAFFDVHYSVVKIKGMEPAFSSGEISSSFVWDNVEEKLAGEDKQIEHGKIRVNGKSYYSYSTPVYFGHEYLGFFMVFTKRKAGKLMLRILRDLENNFIDDQLMIIISLNRRKKES